MNANGFVQCLVRNLFSFDEPARPGEEFRFRIIETVFAFAALNYAWTWALYMQRHEVVVRPLGLANYLDVTVLFGPWAFVLAAVISIGLMLGVARIFRYGYAIAFVGLILQFAGRYSAGEIPHSSNLTGVGILAFALSWAFFDEPRFRRRFSLGFIYFMLGVTYLSAGLSKLIATGPLWVDGRHLWTWIQSRHFHDLLKVGADNFTAIEVFLLEHWWAATLSLTIGLVTELGAWLMWIRRTRMLALLAILAMHIGIYFTMGIFFLETTVLLIILLLPLETIYAQYVNWSPKAQPHNAMYFGSRRETQ